MQNAMSSIMQSVLDDPSLWQNHEAADFGSFDDLDLPRPRRRRERGPFRPPVVGTGENALGLSGIRCMA